MAEHIGDLLSLYIDGEINGQDRKKIEKHLALCPECKEQLHELSSMRDQIKSAFKMIDVPDRIEDMVMSEIHQVMIKKYIFVAITLMAGMGLFFFLSMIQILTAGLHIFQTTFSISKGLIYAIPSLMSANPNVIVAISIFIIIFIVAALLMLRYLIHTMGKTLRVEDI